MEIVFSDIHFNAECMHWHGYSSDKVTIQASVSNGKSNK